MLPAITSTDKTTVGRMILGNAEKLGFNIVVTDIALSELYPDGYDPKNKSSGVIHYGPDTVPYRCTTNIIRNPNRAFNITNWYDHNIRTIHVHIDSKSASYDIIEVIRTALSSIKRKHHLETIPKNNLSQVFPHAKNVTADEDDVNVIIALLLGRDIHRYKHKPRLMIELLKNDPQHLERYLNIIKSNTGQYHNPRYIHNKTTNNKYVENRHISKT